MTTNDIIAIRLRQQQLQAQAFTAPKELVAYFGAMQAQDFAMARWAAGIRTNTTAAEVEDALNSGDIIRTHILRPTWHIVAATDVRWMLALTAPHIRPVFGAQCRACGLDAVAFRRCKAVIERALRDHNYLTRNEIMARIGHDGIDTSGLRATLIMLDAELDGLVCSGPAKGKQNTYALLDERTPPAKPLPRAEALATLALRYFTSHGPATARDFSWWSGLNLTNARRALDGITNELHCETLNGAAYWFTAPAPCAATEPAVQLLPAFDEYLVSYKDRSAALDATFTRMAITNNGIFKPTIIAAGKVAGTWQRNQAKNGITIEVQRLGPGEEIPQQLIMNAALRYCRFTGMQLKGLVISWPGHGKQQ